jgi:hypothetical protein
VDSLLEVASRQFAGNEWVAAVLEAMRSIAATRDRERVRKEALYSSSTFGSRLAAKFESSTTLPIDGEVVAAYLRRKPAQGKADE